MTPLGCRCEKWRREVMEGQKQGKEREREEVEQKEQIRRMGKKHE